MLKPETN